MNKLWSLFSVKKFLECRYLATRLTADGKEIPKRKIIPDRITLIGADGVISITDLKNAQNLSQKRDLKLVKIQDMDTKTRRPVYKLMTNAEYHEEELDRRKAKKESHQNATKGQKLLTLSSRIAEHDLMTGVKKMVKLLEKQYQVKVVIGCDREEDMVKAEQLYNVIAKNITTGKLVQKRNKGSSLRFQLLPTRDSSTADSNLDSGKNENDKGPL